MKMLFSLTAGGPEEAPKCVIEWLDRVLCAVRQAMNGAAPLTITVWPYRDGAATYLVCDVHAQGQTVHCYDMTIFVGGSIDLRHIDEPTVPDLADALHLASLVANELGAKVELGMRETISEA
ncbi:hypothetical protein [Achromobacter anxifer]|uniref:hypothetical protein n=1 Tax=Achromobacter anxifer TaxID=1287737 RepID=UPI0023F70235|nr:hypothetical protein [Achromobacter anxifer]MDF8364728.1 hypothetical protein [Achromobacter anxifer]